jgi:hypothetical protein
MANFYTNIPTKTNSDSGNSTVQAFDAYYTKPLEIKVSTINGMTGFFESKGFDKISAETISVAIIKQAKQDGANPMEILDTLIGLDKVEISAVVAEILNYNRYKTSFLGYAQEFSPVEEVNRNVVIQIPPVYDYSVTASSATVVEGGAPVIFTIHSTVPDYTVLTWRLLGVQSADIVGGNLNGSVTIIGGQAVVECSVVTDTILAEDETIEFHLTKGTAILAHTTVDIIDTSINILADYILIEYTFDTGLDLDTRTRLASPAIGSYLGWGRASGTQPTIIAWGGDNTGIGTEAVLINVANFKIQYPQVENIVVDCRAQWYGTVGTTPVGLKVTLYQGGEISPYGFTWINETSTSQQVLDTKLKNITLLSTDPNSIGSRVATLKYNLVTGVGFLESNDTTVYP